MRASSLTTAMLDQQDAARNSLLVLYGCKVKLVTSTISMRIRQCVASWMLSPFTDGPSVLFIHLTTMLSAKSRAFTISTTYKRQNDDLLLTFWKVWYKEMSSPSDVESQGVLGPSGCYIYFLFLQTCPLLFWPPWRIPFRLLSWSKMINFTVIKILDPGLP